MAQGRQAARHWMTGSKGPLVLCHHLCGYEALTGSVDDFGFEDYLNSKEFYPLFSISQLCVVLHVHPSILL